MSAHAHTADHAHHDDHHREPGFLRKYLFSTDHKMIGIQYGLTAMAFLLFGFYLMMVMRWSIAYPNTPMPVVGWILEATGFNMLGERWAPDGIDRPTYAPRTIAFRKTVTSLIGMC